MIVNTKTGKLSVNATEKRYLSEALKVLAGIAKHAEGQVASAAETAANEIEGVFNAMGLVVTKEGEPVAPPY